MNLHINCEGNTVLEFGCGCNKAKVANTVSPASRKITVYQVMVGTESVAEFTSLPEARAKAVEVKGRVKITNKTETA